MILLILAFGCLDELDNLCIHQVGAKAVPPSHVPRYSRHLAQEVESVTVLGAKNRKHGKKSIINDHLAIVWERGIHDKGLRLHLHYIWPRGKPGGLPGQAV
jgi:hypothetical protein